MSRKNKNFWKQVAFDTVTGTLLGVLCFMIPARLLHQQEPFERGSLGMLFFMSLWAQCMLWGWKHWPLSDDAPGA